MNAVQPWAESARKPEKPTRPRVIGTKTVPSVIVPVISAQFGEVDAGVQLNQVAVIQREHIPTTIYSSVSTTIYYAISVFNFSAK